MALFVNVALLISWSVVAPLKFVRIVDETGETDEWGRPVESYSVCTTENPNAAMAVVIPLLCVNFLAVNPTETVLMSVKPDMDPSPASDVTFETAFRNYLNAQTQAQGASGLHDVA